MRKPKTLRVAYIGIGVMGSRIVKNLRNAGISVDFIVHRNRESVAELTRVGARELADYATLTGGADVVMMTVPDSSVVEPLLLEDGGVAPHLRSGQLVVDMSTSDPLSTLRIADVLSERDVVMLDAPLTGSKAEAEEGRLNVICGGPRNAYLKVKPLFEAIAKNIFHVGPVGTGHAIKLINNFLGQVSVAAIAEVLPLAKRFGIDLESLFHVVSVSGGNSFAFQGLLPRVMAGDFEVYFKQRLVHKDLRYINELSRALGTPTPLAATLLTIHDMALASGYGDLDFSTLVQFWGKISGVHVSDSENQ